MIVDETYSFGSGCIGPVFFTLLHVHHIISVEKTNLKTSNIYIYIIYTDVSSIAGLLIGIQYVLLIPVKCLAVKAGQTEIHSHVTAVNLCNQQKAILPYTIDRPSTVFDILISNQPSHRLL